MRGTKLTRRQEKRAKSRKLVNDPKKPTRLRKPPKEEPPATEAPSR